MSKKGRRKRTKAEKLFTAFKVQMFFMILVVAAIAYYYVGGYAAKVSSMKEEAEDLVVHSTTDTFRQIQTSLVYDANGEVISVLKGEKDVYYVEYDEIPTYVTQALISIEDKKFYDHNGVDYKAILRAVIAMIKNGEVTQGGSTITQQLARNIFLSNEKTWERKVEEIYVAVELENKYSKEQILEFYLNNVYFANGYYGIQAAAKGYFNKNTDELTLPEICYLIAIPNSPSYYDPVAYPENTEKRKNLILQEMYEDKVISQTTYENAINTEIVLNRPEQIKNDYAETYTYYCATRILMELDGFEFKTDFSTEAEEEAYNKTYEECYDIWNEKLFTAGYRIYTSIDLTMQQKLQDAIDTNLESFTDLSEDGIYELQSAGVCLDNSTGMVKAIVGGRSQDVSGYTLNRAFQSYRQPGSSIKPLIVYTPSIENGYTPDTIVVDEPIEDGPENSSGTYSGEITLREAVMYSKNTIAWKLFEELTPRVGLQYLLDMGFSNIVDDDYVMAAALGGLTNGVSPLEMARGYCTIENDGYMRNSGCIVSITDASGNLIYEVNQEETAIYKENAARIMTSMLQSVVTDGTAKGLTIGDIPIAGKTGTTNSNKDGWFVGYSPYYTTSIWVGYDLPKKVPGLTGSSYPASIWQDFMTEIHEGLTYKAFLEPVTYIGEDEDSLEGDETTDEENPEGDLAEDETPEDGAGNTNGGNPPSQGGTPSGASTGDNNAGDDSTSKTYTITVPGDEIPWDQIPDNATDITVTHN